MDLDLFGSLHSSADLRFRMRNWAIRFGVEQVSVWYRSSEDVIAQFQTVGRRLKLLGFIRNPFPFYNWIMGFHERHSDREALRGPILENPSRIVEVGCGTGYLLGLIAARVGDYAQKISAVDLSQRMLDDAKCYLNTSGLLLPQVEFVNADCRALPWADAAFDLYVSSFLLDMLPDNELAETLKEMERVLRPGGQAILITMTVELEDASWAQRLLFRFANAFYISGYRNGRWNPIWRFLCAGYAPHCRPIALRQYLQRLEHMQVEFSGLSRVTLFPVRIYYLRKTDG